MAQFTTDKINRETVTNDSGGTLKAFIQEAHKAGVTILTDQKREHSRKQFLSNLSAKEDLWIFAYGSLMWNPTIDYTETRMGHAIGWHRDFCIHQPIGRGSIKNPGLMMGLNSGGDCHGKVYRISAEHREQESAILWKREMNTDIYIPKWINVQTPSETIKALAFTVNQQNNRYRKINSLDEKAQIISTGMGQLGSNKDYLFNTVLSIKEMGIHDYLLEKLAEKVKGKE